VELGGAADCAGALRELEALHVLFPRSTYLQGQAALAHYALRNYEAAEQLFEELRRNAPYRLENLDTYSNIL
jgi:anaphase-promoting complex subunit 8